MRVLVAGATGVIGRRLVPMLLAEGHDVTAMVRSPGRSAALDGGVQAVVADALDAPAVLAAVAQAEPDAIIHQLTALPQRIDPRRIERDFAVNDQLRVQGTRNLVAAARAAGTARVVAQSIAFAYQPGPAGTIHGEQDPLTSNPPASFRRSAEAVSSLESSVRGADGVVLRYGYFYGPGSAVERAGSVGRDVQRRRLPIVGRGTGVWSFVHVDDAARAAVAALAARPGTIFNVVDDDPAPVAEWLPAFARAIGAPRPLRVPAALARLVAGSYGVATMTVAQGASNALARRELGWQPAYPTWREGFAAGLDP